MKNIYKSILYIAFAVTVIGCAKVVGEGTNAASKRYFDAWMSIHHPTLTPTWDGKESATGIYIMPEFEVEGTGKTVEKDGFVLLEYTKRDLTGNITEYTDSIVARQLGEYVASSYYGPKFMVTYATAIPAGLLDATVGMKVGGKRKVIIPSWMMTYSSYSTAAEYLNHSSDYASAVYEFKVKDFTDSVYVWEADSIERYIVKSYGEISAFSNDTTGFYFRNESVYPEDAKEFPKDTAIYINYTGKLLNGLVFDTTSEKIAKDNNIYDATRTYGPVRVLWSEGSNEVLMGDDESGVISGFAMAIKDLKYSPADDAWKDKGTGIFTSDLGYNYSGSGKSIPSYASLIFDIEVVDEPED